MTRKRRSFNTCVTTWTDLTVPIKGLFLYFKCVGRLTSSVYWLNWNWFWFIIYHFYKYSQTCIKRSPLIGTKKKWPYKTGDILKSQTCIKMSPLGQRQVTSLKMFNLYENFYHRTKKYRLLLNRGGHIDMFDCIN